MRAARERVDGPDRVRRSDRGGTDGLGAGMRIAAELISAIAVATVLGLLLDRWLGTGPWMMIGFFLLGVCAGTLNVWRTYQELERRTRERRAARTGSNGADHPDRPEADAGEPDREQRDA